MIKLADLLKKILLESSNTLRDAPDPVNMPSAFGEGESVEGDEFEEPIKRKKKKINEDVIGEFSEGVDIFRNPKTITNMTYDIRGISTPTGDFFVIDSNRVIHFTLAKWLRNNYMQSGMPEFRMDSDFVNGIKTGYIPWMRKEKSNDFYLSETYSASKRFKIKELIPYANKYIPKIKSKNPQYNFIPKSIAEVWRYSL